MVKIKIDMENREKLKRLHTATHIINFCSREVLGNHVWQNGSNLKANIGTLDITHYKNLSLDEVFKIERLANKIVFENKNVFVEELNRTKAEKKYGFTLYQGGAIPMKTLRVIKIEGSDIEACGGLHMESTGGIGLIKLKETQKIQDGVVRLKFVVNDYALELIEEKQEVLSEVGDIFSVEEKSVISASNKFFKEWKEQRKEIERFKLKLKKGFLNEIKSSKKIEFDLCGDYEMGFLMEIFTQSFKDKKSFKLVSDKFVIATSDVKVKDFKKEIKKGKFNIYVL